LLVIGEVSLVGSNDSMDWIYQTPCISGFFILYFSMQSTMTVMNSKNNGTPTQFLPKTTRVQMYVIE
jgi:hypothetical protein